ncbi:hypothetical protein GWK47_034865 [Chionoecetes opilio]|uniref:Uncharacterized protein n=1 Tax=Chionoecetes opilio TaxID=41210 RepID=A0A8J4YIL6_CHIOP|nr:hypothetical protein GWK47_034865 [Chionoecetes opilio]
MCDRPDAADHDQGFVQSNAPPPLDPVLSPLCRSTALESIEIAHWDITKGWCCRRLRFAVSEELRGSSPRLPQKPDGTAKPLRLWGWHIFPILECRGTREQLFFEPAAFSCDDVFPLPIDRARSNDNSRVFAPSSPAKEAPCAALRSLFLVRSRAAEILRGRFFFCDGARRDRLGEESYHVLPLQAKRTRSKGLEFTVAAFWKTLDFPVSSTSSSSLRCCARVSFSTQARSIPPHLPCSRFSSS